jgi:CRISPR-associated protein Cmr2
MSYLLAASIGPVQGFIAAARRTRDLWGGSMLLSEIAKAVARSIHLAAAGSLVFPAPSNPETDLAPNTPYLVANIVLAELPSDAEFARSLAAQAQEAAESRWQEFVKAAHHEVSPFVHSGRWEQQRQNVLETYFAWQPTSPATYKQDRARLMRQLAARKSCRDFLPWTGTARVPKSSLDGARESVWKDAESVQQLPHHLAARLRLGRQEQLDVIGITKRLGLGAQQFPSVARIAAEPWLMNLPASVLAPLNRAASSLVAQGLVQLPPRRFPQFSSFPFEADLLYPARLRELTPNPTADVLQARSSAYRSHGQPSPYLALLLADGDRMGATIGDLSSPEEHRRFSQALAGFATNAGQIVSQHHGALVYAGGDDVLAMLPLNRALSCAAELRSSFAVALQAWSGPTLSVGIIVSHCLEDLEYLLSSVRAAEKLAKQPDRNGLAIHYAPRGHGGYAVRLRWKRREDDGDDAHEEMLRLQQLFALGILPDKIAYQIGILSRDYKDSPVQLVPALQADALRILRRKPGIPSETKQWMAAWIRRRLNSADDLAKLANQLIIAQHFAAQSPTGGVRA